MTNKDYEREIKKIEYRMVYWSEFSYHQLTFVPVKKKAGRGDQSSYNDVIIMLDTETSKSQHNPYDEKGKIIPVYNYVVAWSLSIRSCHHNIVTLYGSNPQEIVDCVDKLKEAMRGIETYIYIHNMSYDWQFLYKFFVSSYGSPQKQLNTKSHYPVSIRFNNGIVLKDSLILAQRSLEKWANDLNVEHKKAVGCWDYNKIRNQSDVLSDDELKYIECDTLAGVECIDATMQALRKNISSIPLTATGIPREGVRKAGTGRAKEIFNKLVLTLDQQEKMEQVYHGGYTHANRHFIDTKLDEYSLKELFPECEPLVKAADFSSSYPFCALAFKYPMEKFMKIPNCSIEEILQSCDQYAYTFKLLATGVRLKNDFIPMPSLQFSKCTHTVNAVCDNGRILCADYIEIYLCDPDLEVIAKHYDFKKSLCIEVEFAMKDYLPRYITDYIYQCYTEKTMLKGADPVQYSIAKAKVNSIYGMMVQKPVKPEIIQDYQTGDYTEDESFNKEEQYIKYCENRNKILNYQHGTYITAYAFRNLFELGECFDYWLYSDTDSCYGVGLHQDKLNAYNEKCKKLLIDNGYGAVLHNNREYWLGIAEHDPVEDVYTEFKFMGAKRYCYRSKHTGKLKITVAGVPKKGVNCLADDINNFTDHFIFSGDRTGKLTHYYLNETDIKKDENGNVYADSVDLCSCDYLLSKVHYTDWTSLLTREINIQIYEED